MTRRLFVTDNGKNVIVGVYLNGRIAIETDTCEHDMCFFDLEGFIDASCNNFNELKVKLNDYQMALISDEYNKTVSGGSKYEFDELKRLVVALELDLQDAINKIKDLKND